MKEPEKRRFRILVGYDGSNASKEAIEVGKKHARAFDARLYVVTCLDGSNTSLEEIRRLEADLERIHGELDQDGIRNDTRLLVRCERPGYDLVKFAREEKIDEMVVGFRRRSKVGEIVFGSICRYVIMEAPCPVVTVK